MGKISISLLVRRRTGVKHRAYRSDHVRKEDTSRDTAEPNDPVLGSIVVEIVGSLERRQEDPLGGYVSVEDSRDDEGGKTESVGDPLDQNTGTSLKVERVLSAMGSDITRSFPCSQRRDWRYIVRRSNKSLWRWPGEIISFS